MAHPLRDGIMVSFVSGDFHRLEAAAKRQGASISALVQQWVLEGLALTEVADAETRESDAKG